MRDGLYLPVGFAGRVDGVMTIGQVTQTVEVTGGNPVVDTVNTSTQTTIPLDQLVNIPRGANLQEMEPMVTGLNLAGKPDVKFSSAVGSVATRLDRAAVQFEHHGDQMQTHAAACDPDGVGAAEVALEHVGAISIGNTDPMVGYPHQQAAGILSLRPDLYGLTRRGVFDGVR